GRPGDGMGGDRVVHPRGVIQGQLDGGEVRRRELLPSLRGGVLVPGCLERGGALRRGLLPLPLGGHGSSVDLGAASSPDSLAAPGSASAGAGSETDTALASLSTSRRPSR